jgi:hypothetical protein
LHSIMARNWNQGRLYDKHVLACKAGGVQI